MVFVLKSKFEHASNHETIPFSTKISKHANKAVSGKSESRYFKGRIEKKLIWVLIFPCQCKSVL